MGAVKTIRHQYQNNIQPKTKIHQPRYLFSNPPRLGVPEDVPSYPDSTDIHVANENNIVYQASADIETVAAFYQEEFTNYGWDVVKNPDTVVGNTAQLTCHNAAGDRMVLALQNNPIGEFTIEQIKITQAR